MTYVIRSTPDSVVEFNEGRTQICARRGSLMTRYIAAVSLLVAAMSAQNAPSTNKGRHLDIPAISREANGSIVSIVMSNKDGHPIAQGSGFLISKDGHVVTNYHVIKNGNSALVKLPNGSFFAVDGVLASDKDRDVAVIKAHGNGFRTLTLGDSDRLQVGEEVVAIGNPLSLESTVSNGIVSAIRTVEDEGGKFVQITVPISPGSSGGPLFNMAGEVVGITTSHIKGGENLNFAIPINDVKPMLRAKGLTPSALPDEAEEAENHEHSGPDPILYKQLLEDDVASSSRVIAVFTMEPACSGLVLTDKWSTSQWVLNIALIHDVYPDKRWGSDGMFLRDPNSRRFISWNFLEHMTSKRVGRDIQDMHVDRKFDTFQFIEEFATGSCVHAGTGSCVDQHLTLDSQQILQQGLKAVCAIVKGGGGRAENE